MEFDKTKIGIKISTYRQKCNMTQKQLAKAAGIAETDIAKYEQHKHLPKMNALQKIADALQISIDQLLEDNLEVFQQPVDLSPIDHQLLSSFYILSNTKMTALLKFANTMDNEKQVPKDKVCDSSFLHEIMVQLQTFDKDYQEFFLHQILETKRLKQKK
jgi:transcriptional regulator with XRE-family HTH domain